MRTDSKPATAETRGFFARLIGFVKYRLRKMFGKDEAPNIYPFF